MTTPTDEIAPCPGCPDCDQRLALAYEYLHFGGERCGNRDEVAALRRELEERAREFRSLMAQEEQVELKKRMVDQRLCWIENRLRELGEKV